MILAHDYYTVIYNCHPVPHAMLRAVRVTGKQQPLENANTGFELIGTDLRLIYSTHQCKHCIARIERARERQNEAISYPDIPDVPELGYYIIEGHRMSVYQTRNGYWYGRRAENGKDITKYFGRTDPRPELEVAL